MSKVLFKVMANSFCRNRHQNQLIEDCLSAFSSCVHQLMSKVVVQLSQIQEVLGDQRQMQMSTIMQQQTDRDNSDDERDGYEGWVQKMKNSFNKQIKTMKKVEQEIDKLTNIYKVELKQLSIQLTKWEQKNKDYKNKYSKLKQQNQKLKFEVAELKDQIQQKVIIPQCQSIFQVRDRELQYNYERKPEQRQSRDKGKSKMKTSQDKSEKPNPKEYKQKQTIEVKNKQNNEKVHNSTKDNKKWVTLSNKITQLKNKMEIYEKQIQEKDQIIAKLKTKIKQVPSEDQEKKKLRTANTTLRGQKTVLVNQLNGSKKQLSEKIQVCEMQSLEIKKLRTELENVSSTLNWQNTTINDLRTSLPRVQKKSGQERLKLQKINKKLLDALQVEEKQLQNIKNTIQQIQDRYQGKLKVMKEKNAQMETILEQKNEVIIKMKTKSICEKSTAYYNDLVKVLSKKVAERDQIIRNLAKQ